MKRVIIVILACFCFILSSNSYPAENLTQRTEGDQSPVLNVGPGGKVDIHYSDQKPAIKINPRIKCKLDYPLKLENDKLKQTNPEIIITNIGPINVVALAVDYIGYSYDKKLAVITQSFEMQEEKYDHLIFVKDLKPAESIKQELMDFKCKDIVNIHVFNLEYYREEDMKIYKKKEIYFIEQNKIFSQAEYSKNKNYINIMKAIKFYKPALNSAVISARSIDNKWFAESSRYGLYIHDGKNMHTGGIPEDPRSVIKQVFLNINRPALYVRPSILEDTGTYFQNPVIIDENKVNVEINYEVENIGNIVATFVTKESGKTYNKSLKPGEITYIKMNLVLNTGSKISTKEIIRNIEKKEFSVELEDAVLYSSESGDEQYMARFVYKINKNNVELIKYNMK